MGIQKVLDQQLLCPMSNFAVKNGVIKPHMMVLVQCGNGSLYAKCGPHGGRCFISDYNTVRDVMEVSTIQYVTQPSVRKERKKDGPTQAR